MALDPRTRQMESPFPRETVRLVRADILAGLDKTVAVRPAAAPSPPAARTPLTSTVAMASPLMATIVTGPPLMSTIAMASPLMATVAMPSPIAAPSPLMATVAMPSPIAAPVAAPIAARPVVAAVAPLPPPAMRTCSPTQDSRLFMLVDRAGAQATAFRVLADTLVTKGLPRVLGITSAAAGEGKTTCAINLALALAENRRERVLLVDASGSAQELAALLGIDETESPPPAHAHPHAHAHAAWTAPFALSALTPTLHVATLARREGQTSYIDFTSLGRLLETFQRAGYAQIILDMPALEGSNEADLLVPLAGGVLLAVRSGRSTSRALRRAVERIGPRKALGVTLMDAPV